MKDRVRVAVLNREDYDNKELVEEAKDLGIEVRLKPGNYSPRERINILLHRITLRKLEPSAREKIIDSSQLPTDKDAIAFLRP